jgi:hypothetical protein
MMADFVVSIFFQGADEREKIRRIEIGERSGT